MGQPMIGICVARLQDFAHELLQELCRDLKDAGFCNLVIHSFSDLSTNDEFDIGERNLFKLIPFQKLSALIVLSETIKDTAVTDNLIAQARNYKIPVIAVERPVEDCHCITYDIAAPFAELVEHIFAHHKCRRVAFIAGFPDNSASEERLQLYLDALKRYDIPYEKDLVQYGYFWESPTITAIEQLFLYNQGKPPIEAIICANDTMAMTVVAELGKRGYTVPQDILVTGCDGITAEQYFVPRLTTASCDFEAISKKIIELVISLREDNTQPPVTVPVPYKLRVSQSCGCKPASNCSAAKMLMQLNMQLSGLRAFHKEIHNMTIRLLDESITPEQLSPAVTQTGWGLARYQSSLVLFCNTLESLGIFPPNIEPGKNVYEFCRWGTDHFTPDFDPFSPKEILPDLDEMFEVIPSKTIMVTLLHEQNAIFGYFVTGFEPGTGEYSLNTLDYGRLLDYQMTLSHVFSTMMHRRSLMAMNNELERLYVHDSMTGVFNRRGFFQRLNYLISQATPESHIFFAAIDMDGLKYINDTFGHAEGDFAITSLANLITEVAPKGSAIARFGGDEFMVGMLFPNDVPDYPEQFRMTMEHAVDVLNANTGKPYSIGASCGLEYCAYSEVTDIDQLMKSADNKLYVDKARHKCLRGIRRKP